MLTQWLDQIRRRKRNSCVRFWHVTATFQGAFALLEGGRWYSAESERVEASRQHWGPQTMILDLQSMCDNLRDKIMEKEVKLSEVARSRRCLDWAS